jgi:tetratricopeptide (TPR) repeat protein
VAFSPDGSLLVTGSDDETVRSWKVGMEPPWSLPCQRARRNLTWDEWVTYFGSEKPYRKTCPNNQLHHSVVDAWRKKGREYVRQGTYRRALNAMRELKKMVDPRRLHLVPEEEVARMLVEQGREYAEQGKNNPALADLRRALKLDPTLNLVPEAEVALAHGRKYEREGKYEAALAALRRAVKLDPELETTRAQDLAWVNFEICRNGRLDGLTKAVQPACQWAQGLAAQISFEETVTGTLEAKRSYLWAFDAKAGQVITINMLSENSRLDSYLTLYGPDGINLGGSPGGDSQRGHIVLAETGVHFIVARGGATVPVHTN